MLLVEQGARQLYASHLRPFLLKHQARLDLILDFVYGEIVSCLLISLLLEMHCVFSQQNSFMTCFLLLQSKFVSAHQAELHFAKSLVVNVLVTGMHVNSGTPYIPLNSLFQCQSVVLKGSIQTKWPKWKLGTSLIHLACLFFVPVSLGCHWNLCIIMPF